jgi:asparagine synthase (glutamine-hydrolysing)
MCAIFGTAGIANLKLIKEISQKQIFRGPDEQNFYVSDDNLVCLGNNRLSVIDKENGKQPMFSSNKRFITVFNGCIYNFLLEENMGCFPFSLSITDNLLLPKQTRLSSLT